MPTLSSSRPSPGRSAAPATAIAAALALLVPAAAGAVPHDRCADGRQVFDGGPWNGLIMDADKDGSSACGGGDDVWFDFTAAATGEHTFTVSGLSLPVLSLHTGCPGTTANELDCGLANLALDLTAGERVRLRVSDANPLGGGGAFDLTVEAPEGIVEGRVTDAGSGAPLAGVSVSFFSAQSNVARGATTGADGVYRLPGLPAGTYNAYTSASSHARQVYDGFEWWPALAANGGALEAGTLVEIEPGVTRTGIDFALRRVGSVSGTVTAGGAPVVDTFVFAYRIDVPSPSQMGQAGADGTYTVTGLTPGLYYLVAIPPGGSGLRAEAWPDRPCPSSAACVGVAWSIGNLVQVAPGSAPGGFDFDLDPGSEITGTVISGAGEILNLCLYDDAGLLVASRGPSADDSFAFTSLSTGDYHLFVRANSGDYLSELFNDVPCAGESDQPVAECNGRGLRCDPTSGGPISIQIPGQSLGLPPIQLEPANKISGQVLDGDGPVQFGGEVLAFDAAGELVGRGRLDSSGDWEIGDLEPGTVTLLARTRSDINLVDQLWDGIPCSGCDVTTGTPITVGSPTFPFNFTLSPGEVVEGQVTRAGTVGPAGGSSVEVLGPGGRAGRSRADFHFGRFSIGGLEPGTYHARTVNEAAFRDEIWDDHPCGADCDPTTGDPVPIGPGMSPVLDFALEPCPVPKAHTELPRHIDLPGVVLESCEIWRTRGGFHVAPGGGVTLVAPFFAFGEGTRIEGELEVRHP